MQVAFGLIFVIALGPMADRETANAKSGRLEERNGLRVLHLSGSAYEMGVAHGRLLCEPIRDLVAASTGDAEAAAMNPWGDLPKDVQDELRGIADGAGVALDDLVAYQCGRLARSRGFTEHWAAFGTRTLGGRLIHSCRAPPPTEPSRDREVPILLVCTPPNGPAHVFVSSLPGIVGTCAGLNQNGISVTCVPAGGSQAQLALLSMHVRDALRTAVDLPSAVEHFTDCGAPASLIVCDGKTPDARVIELCNGLRSAFGSSDEAERRAPFSGLRDAVRRSAALLNQESTQSATAMHQYLAMAKLLSERQQPITAFEATEWIRAADREGRGSLGIVLEASTLRVNVVGAASNATIVDLGHIGIRHARSSATLPSNGMRRGRVEPRKRAEESEIPEFFRLDQSGFDFDVEPWMVSAAVLRSKVRFASPIVTEHKENNTVHGELFRPFGAGSFPCILMLHIAGGDFELSRAVSQMLASQKIAVLFIKMPYYGERRPSGVRVRMLSNDLERGLLSMRQTVLDLRRACDWIETEPDLDSRRIGVMGISLGAITGSLASAIEPRITHACLIMGGAALHHVLYESVEREAKSYREQWVRAGGTRESFAKVMGPYDPATYANRLSRRVVLMISASEDKTIPRQCTQALWDATGRQRVIWYPAGHYSMAKYLLPAMADASRFFHEWPDRARSAAATP